MNLKQMTLACIFITAPLMCQKENQRKTIMTFNQNIVELCKINTFFRKEVITGPHSQVVLMSIKPGQDIGQEIHKVDQTLVFVQGTGEAIINGQKSAIAANHLVFVPAGTQHNFINTGKNDLKLYTIYAPAQHKPGTVEQEKMNDRD